MTTIEYATKIPQLEELFVIYSSLTRSPYVSCEEEDYKSELNFFDEVIMYTKEEAAKSKAKELEDADIPVVVMKVPNDQLLLMFSELYLFGVDGFRIHTEEGSFFYLLDEIVRRPDYSKLPEEKRPLENSGLQLSMLYFMQEIRRKTVDKTSKKLHDLEEEMIANVMRSKFLVPVKETEKDGKKEAELLMMKMNDDSVMIPIFSDAAIFSRFAGKGELQAIIMPVDKLSTLKLPENVTGFNINPNGVGVPIRKEYLEKLLQTSSWKV